MSRKDYIAIARIIADNDSGMSIWTVRAKIAEGLADYLASDNPLFDRRRFIAACKVAS